jgi:hypothetical protein
MFATSLYSRRANFFSSSSVMMINPYSEYAEHMEVERMIAPSGKVGRAASPYVLEIR